MKRKHGKYRPKRRHLPFEQPSKPQPKGGTVVGPSSIVSGRFYALTILGELPPEMAGTPEGEVAKMLFDGFNAKLTVLGTVRGYDLKFMTELPPSEPVALT